MANQNSVEGSSSGNVPMESSDSTVQINIKTLESQIYSFQVDKNILVSSFKEKIANDVGVPVDQQRLIFRGKVLKDEHPLSEYHVDNGHTLHLVARQPAQSQDPSGAAAGDSSGNNNNRVNDPTAGAPRNRVGQITHSVVLGTLNVGDQGEGGATDISRVIGAVLNSIGIGNQPMANATGGFQSMNLTNNPGPPIRDGTEGTNHNVGGQNQAQSGQAFPSQPFQSLSQVMQIPLAAAALPLPTINMPIPSSLTTISEYINSLEAQLQNVASPNSSEDIQGVDLPSNAQGLHTPEALSIVLRQTERLLTDQVASLSHIAGRLEQERESSDLATRVMIQSETAILGYAMQLLGSLFLELGRTILTLRMGRSPTEAVVNAGPAVYISSTAPNPIMVQPQISSSFGGFVPHVNPTAFGSTGITGPRNVNIHIHTGTSRPVVAAVGTRGISGDGVQGERTTGTGSTESGPVHVLPGQNIIIGTLPSRLSGLATSNVQQPGSGASNLQPSSNPSPLSSLLAQVNSQVRSLVGGDSPVQSGQVESNIQNTSTMSASRDLANDRSASTMALNRYGNSSVTLPSSIPQERSEDIRGSSDSKGDVLCSGEDSGSLATGQIMVNHEETAPGSSEKHDVKVDAKDVPLGLGLGGLDRKRRVKQQKPLAQSNETGTSSDSRSGNQQTISRQQVGDGGLLGGQGSVGEPDMASVMSQVLDSPALNGLLSGVSEQTGVGSPNVLRNMLQEFTQNPQMRNVVNQIAQQVDTQEVENMFSGTDGQAGGLDLSRMFQQMMPIVSRAFSSSGVTLPQPRSVTQPQPRQSGYGNINQSSQTVAQAIENVNAPEDVFRAVVENSFQVTSGESGPGGVVDALCSDEDLVNEYLDLLASEMRRRSQD